MEAKNKILIQAPDTWIGLRLDKALSLHPDIQTRSRAENLIERGLVLVNSLKAKASARVSSGMMIEVTLPSPESQGLVPLHAPLEIFYEDQDLMVINKPAGLVVHPSAGHAQDTLVNILIAHTDDLSMGFSENRPGIIHRLDRDTSGLLVVAKNDQTQLALSQDFQKRNLHRVYHAICFGVPLQKKGTIQSFLARHPSDRKKFASVRDDRGKVIRDPSNAPSIGKWAVTHFEVLDQVQSHISYLRIKLETGRTHQIRIHLSEAGHPILKDDLYGAQRKLTSISNQSLRTTVQALPRFTLHARELGFTHPRTKEFLLFKVNWPEDVSSLIERLNFPQLSVILNS